MLAALAKARERGRVVRSTVIPLRLRDARACSTAPAAKLGGSALTTRGKRSTERVTREAIHLELPVIAEYGTYIDVCKIEALGDFIV